MWCIAICVFSRVGRATSVSDSKKMSIFRCMHHSPGDTSYDRCAVWIDEELGLSKKRGEKK